MRRNSNLVAVTFKIPAPLLKEIDQLLAKMRLLPYADWGPEDHYTGGRSAVLRLLLRAGLKALKKLPRHKRR